VKKWKCLTCCYIYGSAVDLPDTVVVPGTLFEQFSGGLCVPHVVYLKVLLKKSNSL
jgi:rubredoxin